MRHDLDIFRNELEQRFSYLRATNVDYPAALEKVAARGSQGLTVQQFGIELQQVISLFIDGHAGIGGFAYPGGYLPVLLDISREGVVGFHADRSALLDPARPYVHAICNSCGNNSDCRSATRLRSRWSRRTETTLAV